LLDIFDNYYFVDGSDEPLSALQFRKALADRSPGLKMRMLDPLARTGYTIESKAWDYFQRGVPGWYLWWGNNVFSYDNAALVRMMSPVSRALEQFGGIVQGVHPHIRVLPDESNAPQRKAMRFLKSQLHVVAALMLVGALGLLSLYVRRRLVRRQRRRGISN